MIPYIILLAIFFLTWFLGEYIHDNAHKRRMHFIIGISSLIVIMGFRDISVGVDLHRYVQFYNNFSANQLSVELFSFIEPAYLIYCLILKYLQINVFGYIFITSTLILLAFGSFIKQFSTNIIFSFFIFVAFGYMAISMSVIRQLLAVACFLFSLKFFLNKQYLKFAILTITAILFHYSAVIILIFLVFIKNPVKTFFASTFLLFIVYFLFPSVLINVGNAAIEDYSQYVDLAGLNILPVVVYLSIYLAIFLRLKPRRGFFENDDKHNLLMNMAKFAVLLYVLGFFYGSVVSRLSFYFSPSFIILIPRLLLSYSAQKDKSLVSVALITLFLAYFFITTPEGILSVGNYEFFDFDRVNFNIYYE